MDDELDALENWVAPLIAKLDTKVRRTLARRVAQDLRRAQRERIKAQQNPDGTPYAPRKPQHRAKQGAIRRRAMFQKLRTARYLKARGTPNRAEVGFVGRVAHIARIHQEGLHGRVNRNGPRVRYPERRLLGYRHEDRELIRDAVLRHITAL